MTTNKNYEKDVINKERGLSFLGGIAKAHRAVKDWKLVFHLIFFFFIIKEY